MVWIDFKTVHAQCGCQNTGGMDGPVVGELLESASVNLVHLPGYTGGNFGLSDTHLGLILFFFNWEKQATKKLPFWQKYHYPSSLLRAGAYPVCQCAKSIRVYQKGLHIETKTFDWGPTVDLSCMLLDSVKCLKNSKESSTQLPRTEQNRSIF